MTSAARSLPWPGWPAVRPSRSSRAARSKISRSSERSRTRASRDVDSVAARSSLVRARLVTGMPLRPSDRVAGDRRSGRRRLVWCGVPQAPSHEWSLAGYEGGPRASRQIGSWRQPYAQLTPLPCSDPPRSAADSRLRRRRDGSAAAALPLLPSQRSSSNTQGEQADGSRPRHAAASRVQKAVHAVPAHVLGSPQGD